jgi:hypothetical protein
MSVRANKVDRVEVEGKRPAITEEMPRALMCRHCDVIAAHGSGRVNGVDALGPFMDEHAAHGVSLMADVGNGDFVEIGRLEKVH